MNYITKNIIHIIVLMVYAIIMIGMMTISPIIFFIMFMGWFVISMYTPEEPKKEIQTTLMEV